MQLSCRLLLSAHSLRNALATPQPARRLAAPYSSLAGRAVRAGAVLRHVARVQPPVPRVAGQGGEAGGCEVGAGLWGRGGSQQEDNGCAVVGLLGWRSWVEVDPDPGAPTGSHCAALHA